MGREKAGQSEGIDGYGGSDEGACLVVRVRNAPMRRFRRGVSFRSPVRPDDGVATGMLFGKARCPEGRAGLPP